LTDSFEFRGHVCLVFPKYGLSLYDYIRFNDYQPLTLDLIRQIGSELFRSVACILVFITSFIILPSINFFTLSLCVVNFLNFHQVLHSIKLVHTDLKPENILFRDPAYRPPNQQTRYSDSAITTNSFPGIVIIDFGSATFEEQHHTRIVCTRHYRYTLCFSL
jgi:dual-specificity kinase